MLFQSIQPPQFPEKCILPSSDISRADRRLEESVTRDEAERACASWSEATKALCVSDVMKSGDIEVAQAGGF